MHVVATKIGPPNVGQTLALRFNMTLYLSPQRYARLVPALALCVTLAVPAAAQTKITPDKNGYSPADDVKLGQEAAAEVRKELPMLGDERVEAWVEDIGRNLVDAIPA